MELTPPILDRFTSDLVQSKATTQENTNRQFEKNCTNVTDGGGFPGLLTSGPDTNHSVLQHAVVGIRTRRQQPRKPPPVCHICTIFFKLAIRVLLRRGFRLHQVRGESVKYWRSELHGRDLTEALQ